MNKNGKYWTLILKKENLLKLFEHHTVGVAGVELILSGVWPLINFACLLSFVDILCHTYNDFFSHHIWDIHFFSKKKGAWPSRTNIHGDVHAFKTQCPWLNINVCVSQNMYSLFIYFTKARGKNKSEKHILCNHRKPNMKLQNP
jgi:hypothetical protein